MYAPRGNTHPSMYMFVKFINFEAYNFKTNYNYSNCMLKVLIHRLTDLFSVIKCTLLYWLVRFIHSFTHVRTHSHSQVLLTVVQLHLNYVKVSPTIAAIIYS